MNTFPIRHIDIATGRSFDEATALFLRHVPFANPQTLAALKSPADVTAMMQSAGDLGLLVMTKLDQGPVVSLLGTPMKLSLYLIGSPLLGARIFERHRGAGLYVPAHVTIYEDVDTVTHFSYDRPSSLLAQFEDPNLEEVGVAFDEKLIALEKILTRREAGGP